MTPADLNDAPTPTTPQVLPSIEEVLQVDKVAVDRGGYRIVKRVHSREETTSESLQTDRVTIERRPMNTMVDTGTVPQARQEGDTLVVPVLEEVLVTVKRLMLVEEVRITRTRETHSAPQTVTLRREEIEIERLAPLQPAPSPSTAKDR